MWVKGRVRTVSPEDFPEVEALVKVHRAGLRMREVPVEMAERAAGRSSIGTLKSIIYMLKAPLAIFMSLLQEREIRLLDEGHHDGTWHLRFDTAHHRTLRVGL